MKAGALYRDDTCVVPDVRRADTWLARLRGLLFRPPLTKGTGLLLAPCGSVHTFGMHYCLDLLFLSREGEVVGWREHVRPWRSCRHPGAHATLELPAGGLSALAPRRGERLQWRALAP